MPKHTPSGAFFRILILLFVFELCRHLLSHLKQTNILYILIQGLKEDWKWHQGGVIHRTMELHREKETRMAEETRKKNVGKERDGNRIWRDVNRENGKKGKKKKLYYIETKQKKRKNRALRQQRWNKVELWAKEGEKNWTGWTGNGICPFFSNFLRRETFLLQLKRKTERKKKLGLRNGRFLSKK